MTQRLAVAALLLQAANAFNFPELLPQPTKVFNHIIVAAAAASDDPAACSSAYNAVSSCAAIAGFTDAPLATQAACLCCDGSVEVEDFYSSCADYIKSNVPRSSTLYSAYSGLASACRAEVSTCGVGAAASTSGSDDEPETTESPTLRPTRTGGGGVGGATTTRGGGDDTTSGGLAECASITAILSSCVRATPSLTESSAKDSDAASCVCYTTSGGTSTYTTKLDDLASECAPWAKTAATSAYSAFSALETFCADYAPTSTDDDDTPTDTPPVLTPTQRPTITGGGIGGGGGSGPIATTATTPQVAATTTSSTRTSSPNPASHTSPGGLVVWAANMMTLVFSFFFLV